MATKPLIVYCAQYSTDGSDAKDTKDDGRLVLQLEVAELSWASYFGRSALKEHLRFFTKTIAERMNDASRMRVDCKEVPDHVAFAYRDALQGVVVCAVVQDTYPLRQAFELLQQAAQCTAKDLESLNRLVNEYQNPAKAGKIGKIQADLDLTRDVILRNMEQLLRRGESLEKLMAKSQDLSDSAKLFYKKSAKLNSCCKAF